MLKILSCCEMIGSYTSGFLHIYSCHLQTDSGGPWGVGSESGTPPTPFSRNTAVPCLWEIVGENISHRNKWNILVTLIIKCFISSTTKTMLGARHYWKFMKWTLFFGSLFTTILIVSERKLYERKSRAFLQLHGYGNNRKQNSYFCSLPDKNWIVDFFEGMWQILLATYKLLSVAWSWLGDLHCSFYFWWGRHRHLSLLQKMVKKWQVGRREIFAKRAEPR